MLVSPISSYGASAVSAIYSTPTKRLYQPAKPTQVAALRPYDVILTSEAKAKSMEMQGYSVSYIAMKLGLDTKTINQFLGIITQANTFKTTYTPPKPTYSAPKSMYEAPKAAYTEPQAITQGREQLTDELVKLPTVQFMASQLISAATKNTT